MLFNSISKVFRLKPYQWLAVSGLLFLQLHCSNNRESPTNKTVAVPQDQCYIVVLGIAQDGGYPHAGCRRQCCELVHSGAGNAESPVCLGLVDPQAGKTYILEASPAFAEQWYLLQDVAACQDKRVPDGIFLTHAHIGHYAGLMQLGREVMGSKNVPVWAMPRMDTFLRSNGPWSQLVELQNIQLEALVADSSVRLTERLSITPFLVPHRDEFSETVGFQINGPNKKMLFIPDIDKWEKWQHNIVEQVKTADYALLDATFYKDGELQGRAMSEVPHPFVEETMNLFANEPAAEKKKLHFIHFNHTNPLLWDLNAQKAVQDAGFVLATEGMILSL
ncbi:MAG: pyrroloquinoline quinone biosynthesis protein PqqB [Lewinellaceae bacterium]|nr:pyrroloquinoline quinone biosynthesis protein PqqB [Saprospiraceae bacterium]MCB9344180.1 pyrroloquinoline quinone biosynthesis protein PqqB [Lewinellaceae bacterium]